MPSLRGHAFGFARESERGTQQDLVVRGSGLLSVIGSGTVLALLAFYPPTRHVGVIGWILVAPMAAAGVADGMLRLLLRRRPSLRLIYLSPFIGIAQLALIEWLAGSGAPYPQVLVLLMLGAASSQSLLGCARVVGTAFAAALSPLLYGHIPLVATILEFSMVSVASLMTSLVMSSTRVHRTRLRDDVDHATALAHVDPLTGLGNRRAFDEALETALRTSRQPACLSLVLCDVNDFKTINDVFGHDAGDQVLRSIAQALGEAVREPDLAFRWAGDEFVVLLRGSDEAGARLVAERCREQLERRCRRPDGDVVTAETGVAETTGPITARELFMAADRQLCLRKARRREQVATG